MNQILFITHNKGKVADLKTIVEPLGFTVVSANDLKLPDIEETGETFEENALIKVRAGHKATGLSCIADDSGLCVDALKRSPGIADPANYVDKEGNKPGLYTARYSDDRPENTPFTSKLLNELEALAGNNNRRAKFKCCIAHIDENGKEHTFEGESEGRLAMKDRGTDGFAYDVLFIPKGYDKTFAELGNEIKGQLSHRGIAMQKFLEHLTAQTASK